VLTVCSLRLRVRLGRGPHPAHDPISLSKVRFQAGIRQVNHVYPSLISDLCVTNLVEEEGGSSKAANYEL
jgi:hypothetical protein